MLERTRAASNGDPRAVKVKTPEEKWGAVLEGALYMHGCVDAIGLPPIYTALAATPKEGKRIALQGLYQTCSNAPGAATSISPVCLPSTAPGIL